MIVHVQVNPMADNDDDDEHEQSDLMMMTTIRHEKRLLSHTPMPSASLMLGHLSASNLTIGPTRMRRATSEQVNLNDR